MNYDFKQIEKKWQQAWAQDPDGLSGADTRKKFYCLDMFPYPSGSGLHVGHWRGYVLSDVYARMKWLEGYAVLHPMGWDAFGLPAENDAIKKGIKPQESTARNVANFKRQLAQTGCMYDWSKEINTTDPEYYKWTQWIFLQMFKAGLAYEGQLPINWCPSCLTGLANEEVVNQACERCHTPVVQKSIRQWVLRITQYAQSLLDGLDTLTWPEKVKMMQRNWIGKSEGIVMRHAIKDTPLTFETYSAHFEAVYADTFVVVAPDHPMMEQLLTYIKDKEAVQTFCTQTIAARARTYETPEPEGINTGLMVIDPLTGDAMPLWIANYAIAHYGTGFVRCSAHDQRDFAFAKKYSIPLRIGMLPENNEALAKKVAIFDVCFDDTEHGILTLPKVFAGMRAKDARNAVANHIVDGGFGYKKNMYKLRDWIFSRQRYWGEPIPLVHCASCGVVPVPEDQLPVTLPDIEKYQPTGTGESPLAAIDWWVNTTCPQCKGAAKRETNTMPQWAGSCWYFLRYPNPQCTQEAFDKKMLEWLPVDLYVGGIEHAILHLLYARFYTHVLHDLGYVPFKEPFTHLFNQGMVNKYSELSGAVEKMSKSKGNVVNPDDMVEQYGSDALRLYMLFMGPPELDCEWQDNGIEGMKRFLQRLWTFVTAPGRVCAPGSQDAAVTESFQQFLKEYQERILHFKPNTAIAAVMEWLHEASNKDMHLDAVTLEQLLVSLSVLIPHITSELLALVLKKRLRDCAWKAYDPALAAKKIVDIVVQVNGKMRGTIAMVRDAAREQVQEKAHAAIARWLENKQIKTVVVVPNKLINFVVLD